MAAHTCRREGLNVKMYLSPKAIVSILFSIDIAEKSADVVALT
jgi:hypothetical protein